VQVCASCGAGFPSRLLIEGKVRVLSSRRFCLACSPFGAHNTSTRPLDDPGVRRRQSWVNYGRRRRIWMKAELIAARGSWCEDCGYGRTVWALEFHHRDPGTKEFSLGGFLGSIERARREADKCFLVCANCHRIRHAQTKTNSGHPVVRFRQNIKLRAIAAAGGACRDCGFAGPVDALEFHHLDARSKEFGISVDGIPRSWARVQAELAKCVLLCANCHREVHAQIRAIGDPERPYRVAA
jgi:5-methylcytosine-specific restriction endonuclease McrA